MQYVDKLKTLRNTNIVEFLDIYDDPQHGRVLLMEFILQNLTEYLEKGTGHLAFIAQVNLANDISMGLSFLHSQGIIHGNLTSNNVLVTENERAKISDYGLMSTDLGVLCPNRNYMPLNFTQPSYKTDLFSFGILGIHILNRQQPVPMSGEQNEEARWQSETRNIDSFHPLCSIFLKCITDEDKDRPDIDVIVQDIRFLQRSQLYTELNCLTKKVKQLREECEKQTERLNKFQQLPLALPSKKWFAIYQPNESDLEMRRSADAVTDGSRVYIRLSHVKEVLVFNLGSNKWEDKCLSCPYFRSSLVVVDNKLIAVGGTSNTADDSPSTDKLVHVVHPSSENKLWGRMTQPRNRCTSITWSDFLAIAGGENPVGNILNSVDILNIKTKAWSHACPLPDTRYSCSAALVNNYLYLLGGWKDRQKATRQVLRCSADKLLTSCQASIITASFPDTSIWEELDAELPVAQTTCVSFHNQLLTFGGTWCECYECPCNKPTRPSRNIYTYNEEKGIFECIGSTPDAQYLCFACVYEYDKIFIAGGAADEDYSLKDVYIFDTARLV